MHASRWLPAIVLLLLSFAFTGCKNTNGKSAPEDLPDLSRRTRPYTTVTDTVVRTGPGEQFRALSKIPPKAKVHVVGRDGGWLLIISRKGNAPGFIPMAAAEPGARDEQAEARE